MKRTLMTVVTLAMVLTMSTVAMAENGIFEDFESGSNDANWRWSGSDTIEPTGGNGGAYGLSMLLDVPTPMLRCDYDAPGWTGDFAAMGVTGFSADLMTIETNNDYWTLYPCFVLLVNHMGTPDYIDDDVYVYPNPDMFQPPAAGDGWANYSWDIPSDFVGGYGELPAGWNGGTGGNTTFPEDMTWEDMMTNVGRVEIRTLYPDYAAIFQLYVMGSDNLELYYEDGAVATDATTFSNLKAMYR